MESIVWFYLFLAAAVLLVGAAAGITVLAVYSRRLKKRLAPAGKERYLSYESPDYMNIAGFCVDCPHSELLAPTACWLVNDRIAQIVYDLAPAQQITLRAALHCDGGISCAEAYRDAEYDCDTACTVDGVQVTLRQANDGTASASWQRDNVDYLLYGKNLQRSAFGGMLPVFVTQTAVRRQA